MTQQYTLDEILAHRKRLEQAKKRKALGLPPLEPATVNLEDSELTLAHYALLEAERVRRDATTAHEKQQGTLAWQYMQDLKNLDNIQTQQTSILAYIEVTRSFIRTLLKE